MMNRAITAGLLLSLGFAAAAAEPPAATIGNGVVRAKLYLPDVDNGYYRGTRFDWSGSGARLETSMNAGRRASSSQSIPIKEP